MNLEELVKTDIWQLYEKGLNYLRMYNVFADTDRNYRMYNGDQWEGAIIDGIEKARYNFIETIVNHLASRINKNYHSINFSSENFEQREFRKPAEKTCELLNKKAAKVWEKDQMDTKIRTITDDAIINDEGIIYVDYDTETESPSNEVLDKNNIQYGNEQSSDIQSQPYIIISKRRPVIEVHEFATANGVSEEELKNITGDNNTQEQSGVDSKYEKDDMCTVVTKMWKENGTVWYAVSTRSVDIKKATDTKLHYYPVAHFVWKEKKGWARGEGEVRNLIPNQLELNKTLARMLLAVKQCSYPQKVANMDKIANPDSVGQVGGLIKVKGGASVDDVEKIFKIVQPASMSTDVSKVINDLISITRDLKNTGDLATGGVNPEEASGKAILAIQQMSEQPSAKQATSLKKFVEDIALIWLDMWTVYTPNGMKLEEETLDPKTGETFTQLVDVPASILENLKGTVKIDVTPKGALDKYAIELTLENFLKAGYFSPQRVGELRKYAEALPDDANAPKLKLLDVCDKIEEEQKKIMESRMKAQIMQQRVNQFLMEDPQAQASQVNDYMQQSAMGQVNIDNQAQ